MVRAYRPIEGLMGLEGEGGYQGGRARIRPPLGDKRIESYDKSTDEMGHTDHFISLKPGWKLPGHPANPQHDFGEDSLSDVKKTMKTVVPCECPSCKSCK